MAIESIITQVAAIQSGITGVKKAWDTSPESVNELPCFVNFPASGDVPWPRVPNLRKVTHTIKMQLMVQRGGDLAGAESQLRPFVDRVISTFDQKLTLNGTAQSSGISRYEYGVVQYAGVDYLGIVFTLQALEIQSVVFQP